MSKKPSTKYKLKQDEIRTIQILILFSFPIKKEIIESTINTNEIT